MQKLKNYYDVLEISVDADYDEVNRGYKRAKNAYSQDSLALYSLMNKEECEKILNLIEEAYTILSDPEKRRQYNEARGLAAPAAIAEIKAPTIERHHSNQPQMVKIVASKRYDLDYKVKQEFEDRIEQCVEFSGDFLREIREYKNVDINRLSDMTKVSKTHLRNIEAEAFESLPAAVYVRGFVFQYAKCLKLNPEIVAESYLARMRVAKGA